MICPRDMGIVLRTAANMFWNPFLLAGVLTAGGVSGYVEHVIWREAAQPQNVAEALFAFRAMPTLRTTRMLLDAGGRRVVLTQQWIASSGVSRARLVDDKTGWWIEVTKAFGVQRETVDEFFASVNRANLKTIVMRVRTRGGVDFSAEVPCADPEKEDAAFGETVVSSPAAKQILDEMEDFEKTYR